MPETIATGKTEHFRIRIWREQRTTHIMVQSADLARLAESLSGTKTYTEELPRPAETPAGWNVVPESTYDLGCARWPELWTYRFAACPDLSVALRSRRLGTGVTFCSRTPLTRQAAIDLAESAKNLARQAVEGWLRPYEIVATVSSTSLMPLNPEL